MARTSGWAALALGLALAVEACTGVQDAAESPLVNALPSQEALVAAVFRALEAHDTTAIRALMVTREEFETLMWPEMPDREQMPFEFSWSLKEAGRRKGLRQLMGSLGGVPLHVESIEWTKEPEVYPSFTFHKGARVMARRRDTGVRGEFSSFDVFVDYGGGWKLIDLDEP